MKIRKYISSARLQERIKKLAEQIDKDYNGKDINVICVLKGATVFAVELSLKLRSKVKFDFIEVSSYCGTQSTGKIKLNKDITSSITNKDVLIIEDIIDTGITLNYLKEYLLKKNPKSLRICTLLDKKEKRKVDIKVDYTGFVIENKFIVGFGLDYDEEYRNLQYIGIIE